MSSCLGRAAVPVKRVWRGLSARLRCRRTTGKLSTYVPVNPDDEHEDQADDDVDFGVLAAAGLGRLWKEVRTCEYRDVHVMWEMLSDTGSGSTSCRRAMADEGTAAGKGAAAAARRTRKGRKPTAAPWSRLVAYCCAF